MSNEKQKKLSQNRRGRIILHLAVLKNGGKLSFCAKGIIREVRKK